MRNKNTNNIQQRTTTNQNYKSRYARQSIATRAREYFLKSNPVGLRDMPTDQAVFELMLYKSLMRSKYLYSMIHPDIAVSNGYQVKMFSEVPLPTASIGFRAVHQLRTSNQGTFCLTWSPNFLCTSTGLAAIVGDAPDNVNNARDPTDFAYSNLTYNCDNTLTGTEPSNHFYFVPSYVPEVDISKYRLVSALLRVSYNGSVMNQSGTMYSCATTDPQLCAAVGVNNAGLRDAQYYNSEEELARIRSVGRAPYGDFTLIRNGMWNYSQNITADSRGVECLYVPLDTSANMFYQNATYYGALADTNWEVTEQPSTGAEPGYLTTATCSFEPTFGTQLNYVVCGVNMPDGEDVIQVEIYYNFEVIPTPRSAPVLRAAAQDVLDDNDLRRMQRAWRLLADNRQLIRQARVPPALSQFTALRKWGPNIDNLVQKLI